MTKRENALRIVRFDHPERVVEAPPFFGVSYRGCNHEGYAGGGHDAPVGTTWTDVWGTVWRKELDGVMGFPQYHPLSDPADRARYVWPDPDDERICGPIYARAQEFPGGDCFLCGSHRETLWEKCYMLAGMETMMEAFYEEADFVRDLLHRVMDFDLAIARHHVAVGVEWAHLGDDLGTQRGPLLSPAMLHEFLQPEYRRLCDFYHAHNVLISFHSCGNIEGVLDLFLDLGIDSLNPVQASANDLAAVRAKTQGRLALQGGVSTETVMQGPPARIAAEVRERLWTLGRDGGYFCAPDQGMPFPPEHRQAFQEALEQYGAYPLTAPDAALTPTA